MKASLTGLDGGRCPACGATDSADHRIRTCWASAATEVDFKKLDELLSGPLHLPTFEWEDKRPTAIGLTFYIDGHPSEPFVFRVNGGPLYTHGTQQLPRFPWCSTMAAAVVQVSTGKVVRISIERDAYPSSTVAEFFGLIFALQNVEEVPENLKVEVHTDSSSMIASVLKDRSEDFMSGPTGLLAGQITDMSC